MPGYEPESDIKVRSAAMRLLARREHSRVELRIKLSQRGFTDHFVNPVLDDLESQNFLSDKRFAKSLISTRSQTGYGPNHIRFELTNRGVSQHVIRDAMEQAEIDWNQCGVELVIKRFGSSPPEDFPEWAKRARYLEQRGFDIQAIRFAIGNNEGASSA
mgnify:CR=1 FL=1